MGSARRVFLGWNRPLLRAAAEWLAANPALGDALLVVPGRRAARQLERALLELSGTGLLLPEVLTTGALTDRLLRLPSPPAPRLVRSLLWADALRAQPASSLAVLAPEPPAPGNLPAWLLLAEPIRTVHAELMDQGLDFAAVAVRAGVTAEIARRAALLAAVQDRYRQLLASVAGCDPHAARQAALAAGAFDLERRVVLVGVPEVGGIQRRLLTALGSQVTALVCAPESLANRFDALGCVVPAAFERFTLPLTPEQWSVVGKPADQADAVVDWLARLPAGVAVDQVTVGVPDAEVVPFLARALAAEQLVAHDAAGMAVARTAAGRLLRSLAAYLEAPRYAPLAALLRHPQCEALVAGMAALRGRELLEDLDGRFGKHLPDRVLTAETLGDIPAAVAVALGPLAERERRPLRAWAPPIAELLARAAATAPAAGDPDAALEVLREGLRALHALPEVLDRRTLVPAAGALTILLRTVDRATWTAGAIPPQGIELLGWLELLHDGAPHLVVTGMNQGSVPEPVSRNPLLDRATREVLGLPGEVSRAARDLYVLAALLSTRRAVHLVVGRRSQVGDPLVPSRLLFCGDDVEARAALLQFLNPGAPLAPLPATTPAVPMPLPRRPCGLPAALPVTAFRDFLASPYGFYLKHVLGLRTVDDSARELEPQGFGVLLHDVLHRFGTGPHRDAAEERVVWNALEAELAALATQRFRDRPRPAVRMQLEQMRLRLRAFARWQAERARQGWRIREVEWQPAGPVPLTVTPEVRMGLRGRIDRIDHHPAQGWAILDYKTGDAARTPRQVHLAPDGTWRDLQLPLYRRLVEPLQLEGPVSLEFVHLPRDPEATGNLAADFSAADLENAWDAARQVVLRIRAQEFWTPGVRPPTEPILAALCGGGLVAPADEAEGEA